MVALREYPSWHGLQIFCIQSFVEMGENIGPSPNKISTHISLVPPPLLQHPLSPELDAKLQHLSSSPKRQPLQEFTLCHLQMKVTFMQPLQYFSQDFDILLPADTTNKNVILLIHTFFYPFQNHIHFCLEYFRCSFNPIMVIW